MIQTICVCGAGTMGSGIAQVAAMSGFQTILFDIDPVVLGKGRNGILETWRSLQEKGRLSETDREAAMSRLQFTDDPGVCKADLVIEAIVENAGIKETLFRSLSAINGPDTIYCSNTSSLSITHLAATTPHPENFAGMHFFNPAPLMKLVEVVVTPITSDRTRDAIMATAIQMGKTPVLCKDAPGFIVNHVARPYYLEALRLVQAGHSDYATIDALMEATGFRMGPFRLMDLIGNDVNYAVSCQVYEALGRPERLQPSSVQEEKVRQGALGKKSGRGYYTYPTTA